ncbi:MAG: S1C family serine protease, partial [Hyphomicrobiales bacterium]
MNRLAIAGSLAALGLVLGVACSDNPAEPDATSTQTTQAAQSGRPTTTNTPPATAPNGSLMSTADLVKYAEPSVVRIENTNSVGSGFIVGEDGYIITNNHVVAGAFGRAVSSVQVTLSDGSEYEASVVGTDPRSDLALIKIDATGLQPLSLAKLDDVQIGDDVVAIGYALDLKAGEGPSFTVTRGIVSQKNRAI